MKYKLKCVGDTTRHFNTYADALWELNESPREQEYRKLAPPDLELWMGDQEYYMVVRRGRYLIPNLEGAGDAVQLMQRLFDEVAPYAIAEDGSVLRPHQMTRDKWGAMNIVGSIGFDVYPCIPQRKGIDLSGWVSKAFWDKFGFSHNGPEYTPGAGTNSRHELHVAYALARGECVPAEVIEEYRGQQDALGKYDLRWLWDLIEFPVLRGAFPSISLLESALSILRRERVDMTSELAEQVIEIAKGLPPTAVHSLVDDSLFQAGLLKVNGSPGQCNLPGPAPISDAAARLSEQLRLCTKQVQLNRLRAERANGNISLRTYLQQEAAIEKAAAPVAWANKVISAIEEKNLEVVLEILDGPRNEQSQRFVEAEYAVQLRNVPAAKRRAELCSLTGLKTEQAASEALSKIEERRRLRLELNEALRVRDHVQGLAVRFEGQQTNWKSVIDALIDRGFTEVHGVPNGASKIYSLVNPDSRARVRLSAKDKTLDYARQALKAKQCEVADVQEAV